ncbi:MAG: glycosyltransferase [Deltaproteobacteria bacterium]|uniref:Glycosyltransferase n=1 Tax=Candidatus Zymogenus saltonus TaxID=2844893 RepID=A0A9D8KJA5_9DELT|nr:glycosyltransferase [Candidatus Zymogenus saltonus]
MKRNNLNVLLLGLDRNVPEDTNSPSYRRLKSYSEGIASLSFVVFSLAGEDFKKSSDKAFYVYPTNSKSRLHYFRDAYILCRGIIEGERKIDMVASQDPFATGLVAYLVKRRYGMPWACHVHADYLENRYWLSETVFNRIQNILGKFLIKRSDGVRAVSSLIKKNLIDMGMDKDRVFYATPAVETDLIPKDAPDKPLLKKRYGLEGRRVLLFVGRIDKQKNLPMLLAAFRSIKKRHGDVILLCVGGGKMVNEMRDMAADLGVEGSVRFTGPLRFDDLIDYYSLSDIFVLPSNYEGTAKVLKEAALASLPLVSTMMSGADDVIVDGRSGFLVPVGDAEAFSERVMELLENPEMAEKMGRAVKERVLREFSYEKSIIDIVTTWERIYNLSKHSSV